MTAGRRRSPTQKNRRRATLNRQLRLRVQRRKQHHQRLSQRTDRRLDARRRERQMHRLRLMLLGKLQGQAPQTRARRLARLRQRKARAATR